MTCSHARTRLGRFASEPSGAACIDHLKAVRQRGPDLIEIRHGVGVEPRLEASGAWRGWSSALQRPPLGLPLRQTAVQHAHAPGAHRPQRPPDARCGEQPLRVIDDDVVRRLDAHRAHRLGEGVRRR
ncbi:hypothetical protein D3C73_1117270 [compost metagenome]